MYAPLIGPCTADTLRIIETGNEYTPPSSIKTKIDTFWNEGKKKFGDSLWNGINYRLEKYEIADGISTAYFGISEYKNNYASKEVRDDIFTLPYAERPNCIYVTTLLETTDGKYILGQTGSGGIHGTTVALLGGILNKDEMEVREYDDLVAYLEMELDEEFGLSNDRIQKHDCLGFFFAPTGRVGIFFHTQLDFPSSEVDTILHINDEHDGYRVVTRDEVLKEESNPDSIYNRGVFHAVHEWEKFTHH